MSDAAASVPVLVSDGPVCWVAVGHTVYLGPPLKMGPHSGMVGALSIGITGPLTVETSDGERVRARTVFVPARKVTETVEAPDAVAICMFDPTAMRVDSCTANMLRAGGGLFSGHPNESKLLAACSAEVLDPIEILRQAAVAPRYLKPDGVIDPRVARVAAMIRADPGGVLSASAAAATVGLSEPYFLTRFSAETGTTFRRYRQWVRMLHVAKSFTAGASLTQSAVDAGFASASHFSDTFRAMIGMSATEAIGAGVRIVLADPELALPGS